MIPRLSIAALLPLLLAGCGATLTDPLAIGAMAARCKQQYEREGTVASPAPPVLPVLACR